MVVIHSISFHWSRPLRCERKAVDDLHSTIRSEMSQRQFGESLMRRPISGLKSQCAANTVIFICLDDLVLMHLVSQSVENMS